nr:ubiquitin-associated domain-containing protein 1-like [Cherax quadricarinatus]
MVFQTEFRRILVTMIEASVRLISADPESDEVFNQILDKLERRHRPRVDRTALRQLTEMGFPEAKATKALQEKRNVMEAMEWLLDQGNMEDGGTDSIIGVNSGSSTESRENMASDLMASNNVVNDHPQDPAEKVLNTFLQYRKKWFQPNPEALEKIMQMGFKKDDVINALRVSGNKQSVACELLLRDEPVVTDDQGLKRDSPIISAILASPVIQLALPKPKTLSSPIPKTTVNFISEPSPNPSIITLKTRSQSLSGSPFRGPLGIRGATDIPNGVAQGLTEGQSPVYNMSLDQYSHTTLPSTVSIDVEMDEPGIESQEMET